jgi:hypothetical protein
MGKKQAWNMLDKLSFIQSLDANILFGKLTTILI